MSAALLATVLVPSLPAVAFSAPVITEYPIAGDPYFNYNYYGITKGPDGAMWYNGFYGSIGRVDSSGNSTFFTIPSLTSYPVSVLRNLAAGPDGNLWVTSGPQNAIAKLTPSGEVTQYPLPRIPDSPDTSNPNGIVAGPDGALWFTQQGYNGYSQIGRITTDGVVTEYLLPYGTFPANIIVGPDGALWFSGEKKNQLGRITTDGSYTQVNFNTTGNLSPGGLATGPDGNIWFTDTANNAIGRVDTAGNVTEFPLPTANAVPQGITAGPGGALWFTEMSANKVGQITTAGAITEYPVASPNAAPFNIASGPNDTVWFTEYNGRNIGVIKNINPTATSLTLTSSSQSGTVGGSVSFTATATDSSDQPVDGTTVRYSVSGSVVNNGSCVTGSNGQCTFSYTGPQLSGADLITAYVDSDSSGSLSQGEPSTSTTYAWDLPANASTTGSVHGHGKFTAANGDKMNVGFHALNRSGTVSGACNIVDQTTSTVYSCTDATVLAMNPATGQATIFGNMTINGQATTYRIDATSGSQNTFSLITGNGYSVGGTLGNNSSVTIK
jgi:streptogramin lyase